VVIKNEKLKIKNEKLLSNTRTNEQTDKRTNHIISANINVYAPEEE